MPNDSIAIQIQDPITRFRQQPGKEQSCKLTGPSTILLYPIQQSNHFISGYKCQISSILGG